MTRFVQISILCALSLLAGCVSYERVEQDVYTITERDTTSRSYVANAPGNRDNGLIYPSSRVVRSDREITHRDSTVERHYPDFIRLGLFEGIGIVGGSNSHAIGTGLFGVFPDFDKLDGTWRGSSSKLFSGGIYRLGIGEWRLRWFRDAKNWTVGTSAVEFILPDARSEKYLASIAPLYLRKRYFLREEIPYIAFTPYFGIGYLPSQYVNFGCSMDVGSIGGLNVRAYIGYATGGNMEGSFFPRTSDYDSSRAQSVSMVYAGLGVSVLDFLNLVSETQKEWKDYPHSSWNVGLVQLGLLNTNAPAGLNSGKSGSLLKGMILRGGIASVALPFSDYKLYAGTSLLNFVGLGDGKWGLGVLPVRLGYWQTVLADELSTEPFFELNYYPSSFIHIGNRLNLKLNDMFNLSFLLGFASGDKINARSSFLAGNFGESSRFSGAYVGFGIGIDDRIFLPEELRYNKK